MLMSRRYTNLLCILLTLFVGLYIMLCFHSRLATDDYYTIWSVKTNGIVNNVRIIYSEWLGRFAAVFINSIVFGIFKTNQQFYFLLPLLSYTLLYISVVLIFKEIKQKTGYEFTTRTFVIYSGVFTALFFFLAFNIGESWFWYCSLSSYLLSIIFFLFGLFFILKNDKYVLSLIGTIICFIYVGGASEVYCFIYFIFLFIAIIYRIKKESEFKEFFKNRLNKKLVIAILVLILTLSITLYSPGNFVKITFYPDFNLTTFLYFFLRMIAKLLFWFLPQKILYIFAFATPFIVLGHVAKNKSINSQAQFLFGFKFLTIILLVSICFVFAVIAGIVKQSGEYRIWTIISFLLAVYFSYFFFRLGYKSWFNENTLSKIKYTSLLLSITILSYHLINQYTMTKEYAKAYDQRIDYLLSLNQSITKDTLIGLRQLPPSGMLYSSEISVDTNHFTNKELRLGYDLNYYVVCNK